MSWQSCLVSEGAGGRAAHRPKRKQRPSDQKRHASDEAGDNQQHGNEQLASSHDSGHKDATLFDVGCFGTGHAQHAVAQVGDDALDLDGLRQ